MNSATKYLVKGCTSPSSNQAVKQIECPGQYLTLSIGVCIS